jgi:hypothetical protein
MALRGSVVMDMNRSGPCRKSVLAAGLIRWLWLTAACVPAFLMAAAAMSHGPARLPYYVQGASHPSLSLLLGLVGDVPPAAWIGLTLSLLLAIWIHLIFSGGVFAVFARPEEFPGWWRLSRRLWCEGRQWVGRMFGVAVRAVLLSLLGIAILQWIFGRISLMGRLAGWDAYQLLLLVMIRAAFLVFWLSIVGAWAFWCRCAIVADGRRIFRRTAWLIFRFWWRFPLRAPLPFVAVSVLLGLLPGFIPVVWPRFDPAGFAFQSALWLSVMLLHSLAWCALATYALRLYARPELDSLRRMPDTPWHTIGRLWTRLRPIVGFPIFRRKVPIPPPSDPEGIDNERPDS